ncbi:MAG: hypothetical protein H6765_01130 [Candidatus Peribacteria bacterium]|nr:MAG: hypothetical protein H6765_01130 [Candidatus Peribacteria bacterium]
MFIENMVAMNCSYNYDNGLYNISTPQITATQVWQWFPSVTGTENLILMAVKATGTTIIYNA